MSEYDHHEADEVPTDVEARAEEFRAAMPAVLRRVVLENLADMLDDLAPGSDQGEVEESVFVLALAEFRADLVQNPHAFDRAPAERTSRLPRKTRDSVAEHVAEAETLLAALNGWPPGSLERASVAAEAQAHATLAVALRPVSLGLNAAGVGPGPGRVW